MPFPAAVGQPIHGRTITPFSAFSVGSDIGRLGIPASIVWPGSAGGIAMYVPFRIAQAVRVAGFFWMNGATVNGNTDCGVYDAGGTNLASTGATAQSGTNAIQVPTALATPIILPGGNVYYLALFSTSATATYFMGPTTGGLLAEELRHMGVTDQTGIGTSLPATLTHSTPAVGNLPIFGFYSGKAP